MKISGKYLTLAYTILLTLLFLVIFYSRTLAAPLSNNEAIEVLQTRLSSDNIGINIGKIGVKTAMGSQGYKKGTVYIGKTGDLSKYTIEIKKELDPWVKLGIIQLEEFYNSDSKNKRYMEIMNDGHKYIVSLTEEGKKMIDDSKNLPPNERIVSTGGNETFIGINIGKRKVTSIVKNIEVKDQNKYGTKDIRLLMGTYEYYPTEIGKKYFDTIGVIKDRENKFRAIIEYDPFKKSYNIISFDSGNIISGQWLSNNVVE